MEPGVKPFYPKKIRYQFEYADRYKNAEVLQLG